MSRHKVIAQCLDKHGNVISVGENSYSKTHPLQKSIAVRMGFPKKEYLHAEIAALVKAKRQVYKIKVVRISSSGELKLAKPCLICAEAIRLAGVKFVEYST